MWVSQIRPSKLNLRIISVICKLGKPKQNKKSYRQISIESTFGRSLDKIAAYDYLPYGIRLGIIRMKHFGFIKGLGCCDAITYVLDIIYKNNGH